VPAQGEAQLSAAERVELNITNTTHEQGVDYSSPGSCSICSSGSGSGAGGCTNDDDWVDSYDDDCSYYESWPEDCLDAADWAVNGVDATTACCVCGGGSSGASADGSGSCGHKLLPFQLDLSRFQDGTDMANFLMVSSSHLQHPDTASTASECVSTHVLYTLEVGVAGNLPSPGLTLTQAARVNSSAHDVVWQHAAVCSRPFLLAASHRDAAGNFACSSAVYEIRQSSGNTGDVSEVVAIGAFQTTGAIDLELMEVEGETVVGVSNYYDGTSHTLSSAIYSFGWEYRRTCAPDVPGPSMELLQEFETIGARSMTHLAFPERAMFLAVAHEKGDKISLMRWTNSTTKFVLVAEHACQAPTIMVSWVDPVRQNLVDRRGYIATASSRGDTLILQVDVTGHITLLGALDTGPAVGLAGLSGHLLKPRSVLTDQNRCLAVSGLSTIIFCLHYGSSGAGSSSRLEWSRQFVVGDGQSGAVELLLLGEEPFLLAGNGSEGRLEVG